MSLMNELTSNILRCLEQDRKFNYTSELCNYIYDKKISLEKIVEIIGPYLASPDRIKRLKAIDLLFNLVLNIKPTGFKENEVHYLTEFFIGRLTDSFLIPCEVSHTLHLLITKWNINEDLIKKMCTTIKHVEVNQQSSEIRFQFYKIIGHFLKYNLKTIKSIESEFILIFLHSIEAEKDPRCLLLIFDLFVSLNLNLDTSMYDEELYETVACYFPIMYNPPKEVNKLHITKENLSERLISCLTCNKQFVPYLVPLLLEKFESPMEEVKINCYQVLNRILVNADSKVFASNMPDFWNALKFDCLKKRSKSNLELQNYVEKCLKLMTKVYSKDENLIRKWFKIILNDLEACLFNLDLNCNLPATVTLSIIAAVYPNYFSTICRLIVSNSIHNYNNSTDDKSKRRIEALQSLYIFGEEVDGKFDSTNLKEFNDHQVLLSKISLEKIELLNECKDMKSIFDYLICYLLKLIEQQKDIKEDERLNCLITLRRILSLDLINTDLTVKYLNELFKVIKNYQQPKYSTELFLILEHFNAKNSKLIQQSLIPNILNKLNTSVYHVKLLEFCWSSLSLEEERKFINYSLNCLRSEQTSAELIETICSTLKCHVKNNKKNSSLFNLFYNDLMQPLVDLVLKEICNNKTVITNQETIFVLVKEICRNLDDEKAKQIQTFIFVIFTNSDKKEVPKSSKKNCFLNFEISLSSDNLLTLKLMESMLECLKINNQDKETLKLVYTKLFDKLIVTKDLDIFQTLINLIEICTAKFEQIKPIINSLAYLNEVYQDQTLRVRYLLVKFYVSIMKSFITTGNDQSQIIVKKLITVLMKEKNLDVCKQAVMGIKYIHDLDGKLSEENHVKCKSFLNQRFYYLIIPLLLKEYNYLETADALNDLTLIESEEESKNEYNKLMKPEVNQNKKVYSRKETDSFVVKMVTNLESKIAAEKENEIVITNDIASSTRTPIMNDLDPIKQTLNLRKNLISNAIILQINYLPKPMIKIELKKLQKIISQNSLNLNILADCDALVNNQIDFLNLILEFNSKLLEDKLVNLINFLLEYLRSNETNMHVKCKILNCLQLMADNLRSVEVIKHKKDVINQLKIMLDHKKRPVRYQAVCSINRWIILGQPV